jgi:hypothetical protein
MVAWVLSVGHPRCMCILAASKQNLFCFQLFWSDEWRSADRCWARMLRRRGYCVVAWISLAGILIAWRLSQALAYLAVFAGRSEPERLVQRAQLPCEAAAPWSLLPVRTNCGRVGPLHCFNGYKLFSSRRRQRHTWNAFALLGPLLADAGYPSGCFDRHDFAARHGATAAEVRATGWGAGSLPDVIFAPNFWSPGAPDWRGWRLLSSQRINRVWGIDHVSNKTKLVETIDAAVASGAVGLELGPASGAAEGEDASGGASLAPEEAHDTRAGASDVEGQSGGAGGDVDGGSFMGGPGARYTETLAVSTSDGFISGSSDGEHIGVAAVPVGDNFSSGISGPLSPAAAASKLLFPASYTWSGLHRTPGWRRKLGPPGTIWLLKRDTHRGQGVQLVTAEQLRDERSRVSGALMEEPRTVVQRYVGSPLLVAGERENRRTGRNGDCGSRVIGLSRARHSSASMILSHSPPPHPGIQAASSPFGPILSSRAPRPCASIFTQRASRSLPRSGASLLRPVRSSIRLAT